MEGLHITKAEFDLRRASEAALQAFTLMAHGHHADHYLDLLDKHFRKAADILGYDLIERSNIREAA